MYRRARQGKPPQSLEAREQDAQYALGTPASIFLTAPQDRIAIIKRGIPATRVSEISARMGIPKELLMESLGMSRATINRRVQGNGLLSLSESERLLGVEYLIGQVATMVKESGDPSGFDAAKWLGQWVQMPLPAMGNAKPASYLDTMEGQRLISDLLAMIQSGAYA